MTDWHSRSAVAVLAVYFAISVLNQIVTVFSGQRSGPWGKFAAAARQFNRKVWAPIWTFFAWIPRSNLRLLIRDRLPDGEWSPWRTVRYCGVDWVRGIWNPDRRREKAWMDLASEFLGWLQRRIDLDTADVFSSPVYQALANYSMGISRSPFSVGRQFMIARDFIRDPRQPCEILFISPLLAPGEAGGAK